MKKLNAKEQAVFDYILRLTRARGYAPSVREIGEVLGYKSTSTVQMYLDRLLSYGYLLREDGKSRSLRVNADLMNDRAAVLTVLDRDPCLNGEAKEKCTLGMAAVELSCKTKELFLMRVGDNKHSLPENAWLLCKPAREGDKGLFFLENENTDTDPSASDQSPASVCVLAILDADAVTPLDFGENAKK